MSALDERTMESPRWLVTRQQVKMPFDHDNPGWWDDELDIVFDSNGGTTHAVVPLWAVDKEAKTVKGQTVAKVGEYLMVVLPPGSLGGAVALVPASKLVLDE